MNQIITNLSLIADAAENLDRQTGAAWRIRSCISNALVWSANSYLYALATDDAERLHKARVELGTLRVWAKDCNSSSFMLDLTPSAVSRTLGLEKEINLHEEAIKQAREKCMRARTALRFKEFYEAALTAIEEQRKVRQERVESIANLLADDGFALSDEDIDNMVTFHLFDEITLKRDRFIDDANLYDDGAVERQAERLEEAVAVAVTNLLDEVDSQLAGAITTSKVNRLEGYHRSVTSMMGILGIDTQRLAERKQKLVAGIDAMIKEVSAKAEDINASIEAQVAELAQPEQTAIDKTFNHMVKKGLITENEIAEAQQEPAPAPVAPKRTRIPHAKAKAMSDLPQLLQPQAA